MAVAATPQHESQSTSEDPWAAMAPRRLSPTAASDYMQCPRMYRWKTIDRLPDPPTWAQARGTLVHAVLEWLYGAVEPQQRTVQAALDRVPVEWDAILNDTESRDEVGKWFPTWGLTREDVIEQASDLLTRYFTMEDPTLLGNPQTEQDVKEVIGGVPMRGKIDRVDVAAGAGVRVVDYKTGKAPPPRFRDKAIWQLLFYALMWWRRDGAIPARLRLIFLGGNAPEFVEHSPTAAELAAFEKEVQSLWASINRDFDALDFEPRTSALCPWCPFQSMCPEGSQVQRRR